MVISAVSTIARRVGRRIRPDVSRLARQSRLEDLAEQVQHIEEQRLAELGVQPRETLSRCWVVTAPARAARETATEPLGDIVEYYHQVESGRLLVSGEPGIGKSVTALQLLLDMVHRRAPGDPVPVRFNLSTWNPLSASVTQWLTSQLVADFSPPARLARTLVEHGSIVPVLDGLDEVDPPSCTPTEPPRRAASALRQFSEPPWRGRPVVVTSRSTTLEQLHQYGATAVMAGAVTAKLERLTAAQSLERLTSCAEDAGIDPNMWAPLLDRIRVEPECPASMALRTPWLLGLATPYLMAGASDAATALAEAPDEQAVCNRLFSSQISAAVATLPRDKYGRQRYSEREVFAWLHTLGRHLTARRR